jgi:hypothetical protein
MIVVVARNKSVATKFFTYDTDSVYICNREASTQKPEVVRRLILKLDP